MKHLRYLFSVSIAVLALVSCQKKQAGDTLPDMGGDCFTFTADLSDTKAYFANDNASLYWSGGESLSVYAVPTVSDGANESLDWSRAYCTSASQIGGYTSRTIATFATRCTTEELFSKAEEGERLVLLAVHPFSGDPYFSPAILTGNGNTFSGIEVSIPNWQYDSNNSNSANCYFMCGTAGKISLAEALDAPKITFLSFRPATSMLSFKFKSSEGDIYPQAIKLSLIKPDNEYVDIAGDCLLVLDNYASASAWPGNGIVDGSYQAIPYSYIDAATYDEVAGTSAVSAYKRYKDIQGYVWDTINTEGTSIYYNYTLFPSKVPEGSYLLIELYDSSYKTIASTTKSLPSYTIDGTTVYGFLSGRRYLSTITFSPFLQTSSNDWVEAGFYTDITW